MPTASDLVTDLPADFETFGQAVATSMADLLGGTTGQVLSKASNTDMDFTWVAQDDSNAIQNSIVDAKGDLVAASANDTPARLAVGNNGETIVADSSTSTGLRYQGNFAAGKNRIINGDFRINQRNFTSVTTSGTYTFDRWMMQTNQATQTVTPQTFTAGTAPVAGYEGTNFLQIVTTNQTGGAYARVNQPIEDVRSFANQTMTVSFWVKANSGTPAIAVNAIQNFGSGGSGDVETRSASQAITTSWARYSFTINVPTIAGKTIGAGSYLGIAIEVSSAAFALNNNTFQIWGVQAEAGSVATAFQTATGTIQGELAACQRYYEKSYDQATAPATSTFNGIYWASGSSASATTNYLNTALRFAVTKRNVPSITFYDAVGNVNQCTRSTLGVGDNNAQAVTAGQIGNTGSNVYSTGTSNTTFMFHYVASSEL